MSKEERTIPTGRLNRQRAEAARVETALRESGETLRLALEAAAMGVWEWDLQTNRVYWSPECYRITGVNDYDGTVEGFNRTVHSDDIGPLWDQVNRAIETRTYFESEFRILTPRGEIRWVANMGNTLCDADGTPLKMLGIAMDISRRKRTEQALQESEERFRTMADGTPVMIWVVDRKGKIEFINRAYCEYFGITLEKVQTEGWQPLVHPDDADAYIEPFITALQIHGMYHARGRVKRADGKWRWVESYGQPRFSATGEFLGITGASPDITENKLAEERMQETSEQLRALSAGLQAAREEERTRISRELHDELGAALTSLKWELKHLELIEEKSGAESASAVRREKIQSMKKLIDATTQTVRRISWDLRPSLLDDFGLEAAIEWQAQQFESRTGIKCSFTSNAKNIPLPPEKATAVFRIVQEALTNISRHAQATRVFVHLDVIDDDLVLRVRDNGRGLTQQQTISPQSLGLVGMRERAHLMGGTIRIYGSARAGTFLSLRVPIESRKEPHENDE